MSPVRRRAVLLAAAMVGTTALGTIGRTDPPEPGEVAEPRLDTLFPQAFGRWRVDPLARALVRPTDQNGKVFGVYDRLFEQTYADDRGYRVMLSVAYVAHAFEGSGLQLHRPEVCYRYAGYAIGPTRDERMPLLGSADLAITRLEATLPGRREPITYWVLVGGEVIGDRQTMRKRRIVAALRRQTLDSLLVRVSSIDPDAERAWRLQSGFADELAAALPAAERARVFGATSASPRTSAAL
jgi:EpsI family protein